MIRVKSIGPENTLYFDSEIKKSPSFVKFYSPSCSHCIAMKPAWDEMSNELLKDYTGDLIIMEVNADALSNIKHQNIVNDVNGFPTIMSITAEGIKSKDYTGNRSKEDLINFIIDSFKISKKTSNIPTNDSNTLIKQLEPATHMLSRPISSYREHINSPISKKLKRKNPKYKKSLNSKKLKYKKLKTIKNIKRLKYGGRKYLKKHKSSKKTNKTYKNHY
jgi:thiol-disulfide isomerase/thioredoxin